MRSMRSPDAAQRGRLLVLRYLQEQQGAYWRRAIGQEHRFFG
jgi:hypothetical protein